MKKLAEVPGLSVITEIEEFQRQRDVRFQQYVRGIAEKIDNPSSISLKDEITKLWNQQNYAGIIELAINYDKANVLQTNNFDFLDLAFSFITLYDGEKQNDISDEYHKEKILRLHSDGITTGVMYREVLNFIAQHPFEFRNLSEVTEMLQTWCLTGEETSE
jgi:hypothetical protein